MPHRVLIVDQDPDALSATASILTDAGYLVTPATNFAEATERLMMAPPDLLIADVRLGAYNGLHLVHRVRVDHPEVLAIITHDYFDPVLSDEARRAGAVYLVKPLLAPALAQAVRGLLVERPTKPGTEDARRWPRKSAGVFATFENIEVTLADVSYGGTRVQVPRQTANLAQRKTGELMIPQVGSIPVRVVWSVSPAGTGSSWCGLEIVNEAQRAAQTWRKFVDSH